MIEDALSERGLEVNRRRILLEEPIRKVGEYEIPLRLHQDVRAAVKVTVLPDESAAEEEDSKETPPKREKASAGAGGEGPAGEVSETPGEEPAG